LIAPFTQKLSTQYRNENNGKQYKKKRNLEIKMIHNAQTEDIISIQNKIADVMIWANLAARSGSEMISSKSCLMLKINGYDRCEMLDNDILADC
jgi:hypothetical protein